MMRTTIFYLFIQLSHVITAPVDTSVDAKNFLSNYGYLDNSDAGSLTRFGESGSDDAFFKAVTNFQTFYGLKVTGILDNDTKRVMKLPRCGMRDISQINTTRRKRYALEGSKWKKINLKYNILNYPDTLNKETTDEELSRAFHMWSEVSPLTFEKTSSSSPDLEIKFVTYNHDCASKIAFDGPGDILAHAFFPVGGGDTHFDNSELWTYKSHEGINLYQVAVHEFGHSLGLSHSSVKDSIMFPTYSSYDANIKLATDDIKAIQAIYGPREIPLTTQSVKPRISQSIPDLCGDGIFDTIFSSKEGSTYVFKGRHFWLITGSGIAPSYPKKIKDYWTELPENIKAAFTDANGQTYFFKGTQYWKYNDFSLAGNYPKNISVGFPGIPNNVEAAWIFKSNNAVYFFKGNQFWKYDSDQNPRVSSNYPKMISNWKGIPDDIDDVFQVNDDSVYFFKNGKYWKYNTTLMKVEKPSLYPRNVKKDWLLC